MNHWRQACEAFGVSFRLETNRPDCLAPVIPALPPHCVIADDRLCTTFWLDFDSDGRAQSLLIDDRPPAVELPPESPLTWRFESLITLHVAEHSPQVFVHAGVVRFRGLGILLPGRSFAGKTTLTAALLAAGAEYYSDDFAVIDVDGRVHPYHCPLRKRTAAGRIEQSPADYGARAANAPMQPSLVVDTEFRPGDDWRPQRVTSGECVLRLLANAVAARSAPQRVGAALAGVARHAVCLSGARGDATETAKRIGDVCDELLSNSPLYSPFCEIDPCCLSLE